MIQGFTVEANRTGGTEPCSIIELDAAAVMRVGEAVEVTGPAGTDLTGWTMPLYNGRDGAACKCWDEDSEHSLEALGSVARTPTALNFCRGQSVVNMLRGNRR